MTAMPQMVATFNGLGGGAIALVAVSEFYLGRADDWVGATTALFTITIGSVSFMGSIIAVTKLQEVAFSGSVTFPLQQVANALILLGILALAVNVLAEGAIAEALGLTFLTPFRLHNGHSGRRARFGLSIRDSHRRGGHARRRLAVERLHGACGGGFGVRAEQLRPAHRRHDSRRLRHDPDPANEQLPGSSSE